MAKKTSSTDDDVIVIKKYANRRLYNTATSSYVTLDHLCEMVKQSKEFVVRDAKTGEDITRSVLTQIIFEEEGKGQKLSAYQDGAAVPAWSREAVAWAADRGLWFSGSAETLAAGEPVTQEELTVLLERLYAGGMAPAIWPK